MLVLDGHGSHLTAEFDRICAENNIIPVYMPPHLSRLLQLLDAGCFAVIKRKYGQLVEQRMRLGFNHIDKIDITTAFLEPRTMAYKAETIQNGVAAAGLAPLDAARVYQQLTIRLKTPTPPRPSRSCNTQSSCWQTPQNPSQLERQLTTIKRRISQRIGTPLGSVNVVIDRMFKAYGMIASSILLLGKEVHDLRTAHEKEKQKPR